MNRQLPKFQTTLVLIAAFAAGCQTPSRRASAETEIRAALQKQVREWNAGNLAGFMETYAKANDTRFASGGEVFRGWQTVFDRYYKKYADRVAMGTLTLSDLEITRLGQDSALAFGRWQLKRDADEPSGLFTLVFRNRPEGWRIVHDHTSSAEQK